MFAKKCAGLVKERVLVQQEMRVGLSGSAYLRIKKCAFITKQMRISSSKDAHLFEWMYVLLLRAIRTS
jgi:hypothetical protein